MEDTPLIQQYLQLRSEFMGYLYAMTRDAELAEEIYQNAAVVVIQHASAEPIHDVRAWAKEIVRRQALAYLRARGRAGRCAPTEPELLEQVDRTFAEDGADPALRQREIEALRECAGGLGRGDGITPVHVGDPARHAQAGGVGEQMPGGEVHLTAEHVGEPDGVVAQRFDPLDVLDERTWLEEVGGNDEPAGGDGHERRVLAKRSRSRAQWRSSARWS